MVKVGVLRQGRALAWRIGGRRTINAGPLGEGGRFADQVDFDVVELVVSIDALLQRTIEPIGGVLAVEGQLIEVQRRADVLVARNVIGGNLTA